MPDTWLTAVIGCVGTIIGAAIPVASTLYQKRLSLHASPRSADLSGTWVGKAIDEFVETGAPAQVFELRLQLEVTGRNVKGSLTMISQGVPNPDLSLSGGFSTDDILQLSYRSKAKSRKQLGVVILRLSDDGTQLNGHFVGYSPVMGCIITGKVISRKN
jgi:hypothetical protein